MASPKWWAKFDDPRPTTALLPFFHKTIKETTNYLIVPHQKPWLTKKTVPLKLIIKLQKEKLVTAVMDKINNSLGLRLGSEMGQDRLRLGFSLIWTQFLKTPINLILG